MSTYRRFSYGKRRSTSAKAWIPYDQWKKQNRRTYKRPHRRTISKSSALDRVAAAVQRKIGPVTGPQSRDARSVIAVSGSGDIQLSQHHDGSTVTFLLVSWAIPVEQGAGHPADDRFRVNNTTYLTGVRVRFNLCYTALVRIRMILFKPRVAHPFVASAYPGSSAGVVVPGHITQAFRLDWMTPAVAGVVPAGPLSYVNVNRAQAASAPPSSPVWVIESSDDTIFTADRSKGENRPLKELKQVFNYNGADTAGGVQHLQDYEVDHYFLLVRMFRLLPHRWLQLSVVLKSKCIIVRSTGGPTGGGGRSHRAQRWRERFFFCPRQGLGRKIYLNSFRCSVQSNLIWVTPNKD